MSIIHVEFTPTRYAARADATPFDLDTWEVATVEFLLFNPHQSRTQRTRHTLHFQGSDNVANYPDPEATWRNTPQQRVSAFLSPQAVCLSSTPIAKLPTIETQPGDVIVGELPTGPVMLQIGAVRPWADPEVEVLYCPPATLDHWAYIAKLDSQRTR
jgi:hypothetical protein